MSILIVEDDEPLRDLLCEALSQRYECVPAAAAEEALALLDRRRFDLMLADLNLPGMSGFELTMRAGALNPDMRVIVITGEPVDSRLRWSALGVFAYLTKPFDLDEVHRLVALALKAGRAGG